MKVTPKLILILTTKMMKLPVITENVESIAETYPGNRIAVYLPGKERIMYFTFHLLNIIALIFY